MVDPYGFLKVHTQGALSQSRFSFTVMQAMLSEGNIGETRWSWHLWRLGGEARYGRPVWPM